MDEEVCLHLLRGRKLLMASAMQMTWQWMSTFAVSGNCCGLEYRFIMEDEIVVW